MQVPKKFKSMVGATIEHLRYLTPEECETMGFYSSPLMIQLSNGYYLIPIRDDEGNDAGAMWYDHPDGEANTIYVQRI